MPTKIIILPCNRKFIMGQQMRPSVFHFNSSDELRHLIVPYRSPVVDNQYIVFRLTNEGSFRAN